jgi:hypothetical protein
VRLTTQRKQGSAITTCNANASCGDSPSCACGAYAWRSSLFVVSSESP